MLLACILPERIACAAFPGRFLHVIFYRGVSRVSMVISFLSGFLSHRRVVLVHLFSRALLSRCVFVPSADSLLFFFSSLV